MRDDMNLGDLAFFYHPSCEEPGIVGIVKVARLAYADETQFDPKSKYYDQKATVEMPRWFNVDVKFVKKTKLIPLSELRGHSQLENMRLLAKCSRLSITPVEPNEWAFIEKKLKM